MQQSSSFLGRWTSTAGEPEGRKEVGWVGREYGNSEIGEGLWEMKIRAAGCGE